jgi:hypothetical protein
MGWLPIVQYQYVFLQINMKLHAWINHELTELKESTLQLGPALWTLPFANKIKILPAVYMGL